MKKRLPIIAMSVLNLIILSNNVNAQIAINTDILNRKKEIAEIFNIPIIPTSHATLMLIKPRAIRHFLNYYSEAKNENWSVIAYGFKVSFLLNGVINSVYYDRKGYWDGIIKKFPEEKLPLEVKDLFKNRYYSNTFIYSESIENIHSDNEPTYAVYVENETSLKCIRIYRGEMEVVKEITK